MSQMTLGDLEVLESTKLNRLTFWQRRLRRYDQCVPWDRFMSLIEPFYPKFNPKKGGRYPYPLKLMLKIHIIQIGSSLSDPAMEDLIVENLTIRDWLGLNLRDRIPDETTILNFRHLLEKNDLARQLFDEVVAFLGEKGMANEKHVIGDATFIEAPHSTKNKDHARDPEMASGKKGNTWHFGHKVHALVDAESGVTVDLVTGPANEHDVTRMGEMIKPGTKSFFGDSGYRGIQKRPESVNLREEGVDLYISVGPGTLKKMKPDSPDREIERMKSGVRGQVECMFKRVKEDFKYRKTRYRGLAKNTSRVFMLFALANLCHAVCVNGGAIV